MISNSSSNRSFAKAIKNIAKSRITIIPEPKWFQFLLDHDRYISVYPSTRQLVMTETIMTRYAYRVADFVADKADFSVELAFRIINRLEDDRDFNFSLVGDIILIPRSDLISELYSQYKTNMSQLKKIS